MPLGRGCLALWFGVFGAPASVLGQTATIAGWVVDAFDGAGIPNATVELDQGLRTLTDSQGAFRFGAVPIGAHRLSVEAIGFASHTRVHVMSGDLVVRVALEPGPVDLDAIVVRPERLDSRIRILDGQQGTGIPFAAIDTDRYGSTEADRSGRSRLSVWAGVPIRIRASHFGYLPRDTLVTPARGEDITLRLKPDSVVERLVAAGIARISERSSSYRAFIMRPLTRRRLGRWGGIPLRDVIERQYPFTFRRIRCVVLNEDALSRAEAAAVMETIGAHEIERVEFLFGGGMMRIYTRTFVYRIAALGATLQAPRYVDMASPPLCR